MKFHGHEIPTSTIQEVENALGCPLSHIPEKAFSEILWFVREHKFRDDDYCCLYCSVSKAIDLDFYHGHTSDGSMLMEEIEYLLGMSEEDAKKVTETISQMREMFRTGEGIVHVWNPRLQRRTPHMMGRAADEFMARIPKQSNCAPRRGPPF